MPQLRDSGNHSTAPLDAHTIRRNQSRFARIFGIETEYGVSVTGSDRPCDAGQTAMMMFQPIVAEAARSTNTYIENGSRLYLDVGSHPEYATAEARDPMDALHWMRPANGDAGSCPDAQRRLRSIQGSHSTVHVFKNNVDSAGHSFGCHENTWCDGSCR